MPNQLSRRTLLAALVAAVPSAALAQVVGAPAAPATPPPPPAPMTGPQFGASSHGPEGALPGGWQGQPA